ncbi:hypothetical protein [Thiothrix lacustris]|uniref:hypothetical protein n=1 Tax=Thiothrix lacustris TaxID=525917 RepID=UPI00048FEBFD|nr:hypothetical protein [Thiothrix lacustris]
MQYTYRAITDKTGKIISFAVANSDGATLWNMRNFYNGDVRTENRESQLSVSLDALSVRDLPKIIAEKAGAVSVGAEEATPDLPDSRELLKYFRKTAGFAWGWD